MNHGVEIRSDNDCSVISLIESKYIENVYAGIG